ncbi:MAG: hypothetical protein U9Q66_02120 [Patescibacteria group bacterium]|nr:hypothetical protein [Patescibacteria group bacterium]
MNNISQDSILDNILTKSACFSIAGHDVVLRLDHISVAIMLLIVVLPNQGGQ